MRPARLFVSYAHEDEAHKDKLVRQFSDLVRRGDVELWQDRAIRPGADWRADIRGAVDGCDIAVLLVSDAFLASEFIDSEELGLLLARREREHVTVLPLIVRPCRWKASRIQALQVLPRDGRAVTTFPTETGERDQAWADVADAIAAVVQAHRNHSATHGPVAPSSLQPASSAAPAEPRPAIDELGRHLNEVVRSLARGALVMFIGEEANQAGTADTRAWAPGAAHRLPSSTELALHLATTYAYPAPAASGLAQVAQYVAVRDGAGPLKGELHDAFAVRVPVDEPYHSIARLPALARSRGWPGPVFVTVNLDGQLEAALHDAGERYDALVYVADGEHAGRFVHHGADGTRQVIDRPNEFTGLAQDGRAVIVRLRGQVEADAALHESFIVTEDEHIGYLAGRELGSLLPATLVRRLLRSNFLFLGHSLADWGMRVFVHRLCGGDRMRSKSWAVRAGFDEFDRAFWQARDVTPVQSPLRDYAQGLLQRAHDAGGEGAAP